MPFSLGIELKADKKSYNLKHFPPCANVSGEHTVLQKAPVQYSACEEIAEAILMRKRGS